MGYKIEVTLGNTLQVPVTVTNVPSGRYSGYWGKRIDVSAYPLSVTNAIAKPCQRVTVTRFWTDVTDFVKYYILVSFKSWHRAL